MSEKLNVELILPIPILPHKELYRETTCLIHCLEDILPRSYNLSGLPFENALGQQLFAGGEDNPYWTIKNNLYNDKVNRILANLMVNMILLHG
jgi:hypothetical protein